MVTPTAYLCIWVDRKGRETWRQYHDETDPLPETWDDAPRYITALYSSGQVKAHNEANESIVQWSAKNERHRCADTCRRLQPTDEQLKDAEQVGGFTFAQSTKWCHDAILALKDE